jgi:hypothetical protein
MKKYFSAMAELKLSQIFRTAFYCFLAGLFFYFVAANVILSDNGVSNFVLLLLVVAAIVLASVLVSMIELRPFQIIVITFYCFLVGLFFCFVAANIIFSHNGIPNSILWLLVAAPSILAAVLVTVGMGILYYNQLCWKILFFSLTVFVTNVFSLVLIVSVLLWLDKSLVYKYYQTIHITPVAWKFFSSIFLSGFIVLYYLTREEILSYFGDMGEMLEPF